MPHEHGAWMMLYAPLLTGLVAFRVHSRAAAGLVVLATAVFLAQNVAGLRLRRRAPAGTGVWLTLFGLVAVAAGAWLVLGQGHLALAPLGLPALALFAWQARQRRATRRQVDRSLANELATVAVMALGAAAAGIVGDGQAGGMRQGGVAWTLFTAYFAGSVLYVKMRVDASRLKAAPTSAWRLRTGRSCGLFHLAAAPLTAVLAASVLAPRAGLLTGLAWAPAVARALGAWARLGSGSAALRRIGLAELGWAAWFSAGAGLALAAP